MTGAKAFICGCAGLALSASERSFLADERPWGLILFRRNIQEPSQIVDLIGEFRSCVKRLDAPVLVDQEGGRVQRFGPPHWPQYPAAARFDAMGDPDLAQEAAWLCARLIANDLRRLGVTVDCMPVLDTPASDSHEVIGDRAYGRDPARIATLGRAAFDGVLAGGVLPVVKHIPGHGRARADSHLDLPIVRAERHVLEAVDWAPFRALADAPLAMTAHVVFEALDPAAPATLSRPVIQQVVRGAIGFDGLLMTDDLSMKALAGPFAERARRAIDAGVDMVLHCNGDLAEACEVAAATPPLAGLSLTRAERALDRIATPPHDAFDVETGRARLSALMRAA